MFGSVIDKENNVTKLVVSNSMYELNSFSIHNTINHHSVVPYGFGTAAVFVAGILAGYIIDGYIMFASGQPASSWISDGMHAALNYYNKQSGFVYTIHVSKDGGIYGGGGHPCYLIFKSTQTPKYIRKKHTHDNSGDTSYNHFPFF